MAIRALVWGENIHERTNAGGRAHLSRRHAQRDRRGAARGSRHRGRHRDAAGARARPARRRGSPRPTCCSGGGTRRMATSPTRWSSACANRVWEGMGLIVLHSGHFSKIFKRADGHALQPEMARGGRARAALGRSTAATRSRPGSARRRDPVDRDVRRALHRAGADGDGVHLLVRGRRGVPLRPDLAARGRAASSISRPATRPTRSTTSRRSSRFCGTPCAGRTIRRARWKGIAEAPNVPAEAAPEKIESRGPRLHEDWEAGYR